VTRRHPPAPCFTRSDPVKKPTSRKSVPRADAAELQWRSHYHQLVDFHRERGHCDVPGGSRPHRALAAWLETQRELHARGRLAPHRTALLDELGLDLGAAEQEAEEMAGKRRRSSRERLAWDKRFAELEAFQRRFGHTRVAKSWKGHPGLYAWRHHQRELFRQGKMDPPRKARLDALGFEWMEAGRPEVPWSEYKETLWQTRIAALQKFRERFGHCRVPRLWPEDPRLGRWVCGVRGAARQGTLPLVRRQALEALHFDWKPGTPHFDAAWERRFSELLAFQRRFGHTRVSKAWKENHGLAHWRHFQRILHREGKLSPERKARLDSIGFEFAEPDCYVQTRIPQYAQLWEEKFKELEDYRARHGHCMVPTSYPENPRLGAFVQKLRREQRRGWMPEERRRRLDALGFAWDSDCAFRTDAWERRYAEAASYHQRFGHLCVTRMWQENSGLASWLDHQKEKCRAGTLEPARLARLDALGFRERLRLPRSVQQATIPLWEKHWQQRLHELEAFRAEHGHCLVPLHYKGTPGLSGWVLRIRKRYRDGTLPDERRAALEALGFAWKPLSARAEARFEKGFAALQEFHRRHGHTRVTELYKENPDLWKFRHYQRQLYRQGLLRPEQKARLDTLGFDWEEEAAVPRATVEFTDPGWQAMFRRLTDYHQKHGHTRVPRGSADAALERWVRRQRRRLRLGQLLPERAAALRALGFEPHTKGLHEDDLWQRRYEKLSEFHRHHGHTRVPRGTAESTSLAHWCAHQRALHRARKLLPQRRSLLNALGFPWKT